MRIGLVCLHRFVGEEQKDPDACADGRAVEVENESLEDGVETAWEKAEGAGEEEEGHDCAMFGFEALEEREEGEGVEEVVEDAAVEEGIGV